MRTQIGEWNDDQMKLHTRCHYYLQAISNSSESRRGSPSRSMRRRRLSPLSVYVSVGFYDHVVLRE
jgi:hypothetical protein